MNTKNKRSGAGGRFGKNDTAVSAVVGVILMVAITVIMAAIVSSWSSGVKAPTTPTTIGLDVVRDNQNISIVITSIDPPSASPIPSLNISYQNYSGVSFVYNSSILSNIEVGNSKSLFVNSNDPKQVIITATYKDGSKSVIYSRNV